MVTRPLGESLGGGVWAIPPSPAPAASLPCLLLCLLLPFSWLLMPYPGLSSCLRQLAQTTATEQPAQAQLASTAEQLAQIAATEQLAQPACYYSLTAQMRLNSLPQPAAFPNSPCSPLPPRTGDSARRMTRQHSEAALRAASFKNQVKCQCLVSVCLYLCKYCLLYTSPSPRDS